MRPPSPPRSPTPALRRLAGRALILVLVLAACGGDPSGPGALLEFTDPALELGAGREATVTLRNAGPRAVGPVEIVPGPVRPAGGRSAVPGARAAVYPPEVPTLNPGDRVTLSVELEVSGGVQPGRYAARLTARVAGETSAALDLAFDVVDPGTLGVGSVEIVESAATVRQGDVIRWTALVRDTSGQALPDAPVAWSVVPADAGFFGEDGRFVGYGPGSAALVAASGGAVDTVEVDIEPRGLTGTFQRVGEGLEQDRHSSDLWVHGDHAYQGTWGSRTRGGVARMGNTLYTWDVSNPAAPVRTDTLVVDARTVNDVKVRADGRLGVITHEGSNDAKNGVTLLDLTDPGHPRPLSRFTTGLEPGVHNVWVEGDHAYLVVDGVGSGLRVLDVSNPAEPRVVASFYAGSSFLHDVYVRDGLAFLSHWNAGLVILDVGHGIAGGSPARPVEVSRIQALGGETHNAWYWPEGGYVFVGEEDFASPGRLHVVDVRNLWRPREVATFAVPGQTPHNVWLDEDRGILHVGWYGRGIRSLDVGGELLGDLARQGRAVAGLEYNGELGDCVGDNTCTWAPQLHEGLLYLADMNAGLVVLRPGF